MPQLVKLCLELKTRNEDCSRIRRGGEEKNVFIAGSSDTLKDFVLSSKKMKRLRRLRHMLQWMIKKRLPMWQ